MTYRLALLSAAGVLLSASPAAADISAEQIALARTDSGACRDKTRIPDTGLVIRGAGTKQIELYGWFIDTVRNARIDGLAGASVRIDNTRGGPENVRAGCSSNGSIVLTLSIPSVSEVKRPKLKLDGLTVALEVYPRASGEDLIWRRDNAATGQEDSDTERREHYAEHVRLKNADRDRCIADNVGNAQANDVCRARYAPQPIDAVFPDQNILRNQLFTRCAGPHGLKAEIYRNILTVTLPPERELIGRCALFPLVGSYAPYSLHTSDINIQSIPPIVMTASGPLPFVYAQSTYAIPNTELRRDIGLPRATVETLVGTIRQTYNFTGLEGGDSLILVLKSDPGYGVKTATPPQINPNIGRLGSDIGVTVEPVQPTESGQVFDWSVTAQGQGIAVTQCFRVVSGTVSPPAGSHRFPLPLEVIEEPRCYGKTFAVAVGPRGLIANPLFSRTASVTLHARTQVRGNTGLVDDRLKIQGQNPLTRP